jgi:hypothetical protein
VAVVSCEGQRDCWSLSPSPFFSGGRHTM